MADSDLEVVDGNGADGQPTQSGSEPKASPSFDVEAWAVGLDAKLDELVEKKVQSFKDKRFDRLTGKVDDFSSQLAEFKKLTESGLSEDDALWRMKVEQKLNEAPQEGTQGKAGSSGASVDTQAILKEMGLDENTPEVANILREKKDIASQLVAFAQLSATHQSRSSTPNPAAVQPSGAGTPTDENIEVLTERLAKLRENPAKNYKEMQEISAKLDKYLR